MEKESLLEPCQQSRENSDIGEDLSMRRRALTWPKSVIRVAVMGSSEVGKTSLINKYTRQKIKEDYSETVSSMYKVPDDKIKLEILDTAGLLNPGLHGMAIHTADAFILVYAVDDEESFANMTDLRHEIIGIKGNDVPMVVVGNKIDIKERIVHPVMADCVVTIDWECDYFEVSAADGLEVNGIFNKLLSHPRLEERLMIASNTQIWNRSGSLPDNSLLTVKTKNDQNKQRNRFSLGKLKRLFNL